MTTSAEHRPVPPVPSSVLVNRTLITAGYATAALLVAIPMVEATLTVLPARADLAQWRFGAAGIYSRAVLVPLAGVALAFGLAIGLNQDRALRLLSAGAVVVALGWLLTAGLFTLDAVEMHTAIPADDHMAFRATALAAFGRMTATSAVLLLFGRGGWVAARLMAAGRPVGATGIGLIRAGSTLHDARAAG
jgi:hypothetical protein